MTGHDHNRAPAPPPPESEEWEAAYRRFETPEEEIRKFERRLVALGARGWPGDAEVLEMFCGRGGGLHALSRLGFSRLEGIDLSPTLVAGYDGPGRCRVGDCRSLDVADRSKDVVIVQGGLHHLVALPEDLERVLSEAWRVLRDTGLFVAVEPWTTPFLRLAHAAVGTRLARRISPKVDALAVMIRCEGETYRRWLAEPAMIRRLLHVYFTPVASSVGWGKLMFAGRKNLAAHPMAHGRG
jgi:SAM-dependent methyltransferase